MYCGTIHGKGPQSKKIAQLLNLRPGTARRVPCPPPFQTRPDELSVCTLRITTHSSRFRQRHHPCHSLCQHAPTRATAPAARFRPSLATALPSTTDTPEATLPPKAPISHLAQFLTSLALIRLLTSPVSPASCAPVPEALSSDTPKAQALNTHCACATLLNDTTRLRSRPCCRSA